MNWLTDPKPDNVIAFRARPLPTSRDECEAELRAHYPDSTVDVIMSTLFGDATGFVGEEGRKAAERLERR